MTGRIAAALIIAFAVFVISRGELPKYFAILGVGSNPLPAGECEAGAGSSLGVSIPGISNLINSFIGGNSPGLGSSPSIQGFGSPPGEGGALSGAPVGLSSPGGFGFGDFGGTQFAGGGSGNGLHNFIQ